MVPPFDDGSKFDVGGGVGLRRIFDHRLEALFSLHRPFAQLLAPLLNRLRLFLRLLLFLVVTGSGVALVVLGKLIRLLLLQLLLSSFDCLFRVKRVGGSVL